MWHMFEVSSSRRSVLLHTHDLSPLETKHLNARVLLLKFCFSKLKFDKFSASAVISVSSESSCMLGSCCSAFAFLLLFLADSFNDYCSSLVIILLPCFLIDGVIVCLCLPLLSPRQIDPSAACSVTSAQIEQCYNRNQRGVMEFYTAKYTYRLDFSGGVTALRTV